MYTFNYDIFYNYYTNPVNLISGTDADCVSLYHFIANKTKAIKNTPKCNYIIVNGVKIYVMPTNSKKKIYIETTTGLLFSIPTIIDGIAFDLHYHFGRDKNTNRKVMGDKHYMEKQKTKMIETVTKRISNNKTKKIRKKLSTPFYSDLQEFNPNIDLLTINSDEKIIFFHKTIQHHTGTNNDNIPEGYREHQNCYFRDNTKIKDIHNIVCVDKDEYVMGNRFSKSDKDIIKEIMERPFLKTGGKTRK
jgi:hypothetical protein